SNIQRRLLYPRGVWLFGLRSARGQSAWRSPAAGAALRYAAGKRGCVGEELARIRRERDRGAPARIGYGACEIIRIALRRGSTPLRRKPSARTNRMARRP